MRADALAIEASPEAFNNLDFGQLDDKSLFISALS